MKNNFDGKPLFKQSHRREDIFPDKNIKLAWEKVLEKDLIAIRKWKDRFIVPNPDVYVVAPSYVEAIKKVIEE